MRNPALDTVNHVNSALMLLAGGLAYFFPFPVFLAAYAVLGPLHYLTELSWLHDRKYFSHGRYGFVLLWILTVAACYPTELGIDAWARVRDPIWVAVMAAGVMAFVRPLWWRIAGVAACFWFAGPLDTHGKYLFFGLYLSTLIHVFAFTWLFVLYGSLKARSASGFASLAVLTIVSALMLWLPPPSQLVLSPYVSKSIGAFGNLHQEFASLMGWDPKGVQETSAMRFIAFAYTYHYLNWFSKTKVIQWHRISRVRMSAIAALYLGFLGVYAYDYATGLKALFLLSLGHVVLEFPLNFQSIAGIGGEVFRRKSVAAPAAPVRSSWSHSKRDKKRRTG